MSATNTPILPTPQSEPSNDRPTNPFTGLPVDSISEFDNAVKLMASVLIDHDSPLADNPEIRRRQLQAIWRGAGQVGASQAVEVNPNPVTAEADTLESLVGVLDVSDEPFGVPLESDSRLFEQGQGNMADSMRGPKDRFAREFTQWRPTSDREMSTAIEGLTSRLNAAINYSLDGADEVLALARNWQTEAKTQTEALITFTDGTDELSSSDDFAEKIREEEAIMDTLVEIRTTAYVFEQPKRVQKDKGPYKKLRARAQEDIDGLNNAQLLHMWRTASEATKSRANFWNQQLQEAESSSAAERLGLERTQHSLLR